MRRAAALLCVLGCSVSVGDYSQCEVSAVDEVPTPCGAEARSCLLACTTEACSSDCLTRFPACDQCVRVAAAACARRNGCEAEYVELVCCALGECSLDPVCEVCAPQIDAYSVCYTPLETLCQQELLDICLPPPA